MKLIVGLGNPGASYARTRHNIGLRVIDHLARTAGVTIRQRVGHARTGEGVIAESAVLLVKPLTYMNETGTALPPLLRLCKDLIVIHDDLDLPLGRVRIKTRGSDGGHLGVRSIIQTLGTDRFLRVKIGIGKPSGSSGSHPADYVLAPFEAAELPAVQAGVERAASAVHGILADGPATAMTRYNR